MYKILWVCNAPSPYNTDLFDAISDDHELGLTVLYLHRSVGSHPWKEITIRHKHYFLEDLHYLSRVLFIIRLLFTVDLTVIAGWDRTTHLFTYFISILAFRPFCVWTDTPNLNRPRPRFKSGLRKLVLGCIFARAHRLMGTGKVARDVLGDMSGRREICVNLPLWVNNDRFLKNVDDPAPVPQELVIACVGILDFERKGQDNILRCLARLVKAHPSLKFRLDVVGDGGDMGNAVALISDLGLTNHVRLRGWLEADQVARILKRSDIFIHAAPTLEPYGAVVLEAMCARCCVIASINTMAALDRISHGINGAIFDPDKPEDLYHLVSSFALDERSRKRMADNALLTANLWHINNASRYFKSVVGL